MTSERMNALKQSLGAVETELLRRKVDRLEGENEGMTDFMDKLADKGVIEYCGCDDDAE